MNPWIVSIAAALVLAFGLTAFTTVSVRSENNPRLYGSTFGLSTVVLVALFLWADLPPYLTLMIAGVGVMIGTLCLILLKIAHRVERP